jgi:hypothetical protein
MSNRKRIRNIPQSEVTNNAGDAEFGVEFKKSKKANKNTAGVKKK